MAGSSQPHTLLSLLPPLPLLPLSLSPLGAEHHKLVTACGLRATRSQLVDSSPSPLPVAPPTPPQLGGACDERVLAPSLPPAPPPSPEAAAPDTHAQAVVLCELALALLPSLDVASVTLLYRVVQPMVKMDESAALQKRAYKILCSICETHATFVSAIRVRCELPPGTLGQTMSVHVNRNQIPRGLMPLGSSAAQQSSSR